MSDFFVPAIKLILAFLGFGILVRFGIRSGVRTIPGPLESSYCSPSLLCHIFSRWPYFPSRYSSMVLCCGQNGGRR